MRKCVHRVYLLRDKRSQQTGLTLIELLVSLVILSLLATVAMPYVETTVRREKEIELRRNLRELRTALDAFHRDWMEGRLSRLENDASEDGYPKTIDVLVRGASQKGGTGKKIKYLRRIPRNPLADQSRPAVEQWRYRSYQDEVDAETWGEQDVYDVMSGSEATALDGSSYRDW